MGLIIEKTDRVSAEVRRRSVRLGVDDATVDTERIGGTASNPRVRGWIEIEADDIPAVIGALADALDEHRKRSDLIG